MTQLSAITTCNSETDDVWLALILPRNQYEVATLYTIFCSASKFGALPQTIVTVRPISHERSAFLTGSCPPLLNILPSLNSVLVIFDIWRHHPIFHCHARRLERGFGYVNSSEAKPNWFAPSAFPIITAKKSSPTGCQADKNRPPVRPARPGILKKL